LDVALIRSAAIPGRRVGRRWLARAEDIQRYLASAEPPKSRPRRAKAEPQSIDTLAAELGFDRAEND
jgi:hypothetical protein